MEVPVKALQFTQPGLVECVEAGEPAQCETPIIRNRYIGLCGTNMPQFRGTGAGRAPSYPSPPGFGGHEMVGVIHDPGNTPLEVGRPVLAQSLKADGFSELMYANPAGIVVLPFERVDPGGGDAVTGGSSPSRTATGKQGAVAPRLIAPYVVAQPLATVFRAVQRLPQVVNRRCAVVGQGPIGAMFDFALTAMGAASVLAVDTVSWRCRDSALFGATDSITVGGKADFSEFLRPESADVVVDAVGSSDAFAEAVRLAAHDGTVLIFGIPEEKTQPAPLREAMVKELTIVTRIGTEAREFFELAVDALDGPYEPLKKLATPILPFDRAQEAFEAYANPADHEGAYKVLLEL
jgi:threonine dehydrogenase-like Zn-dependent dehydrogenase